MLDLLQPKSPDTNHQFDHEQTTKYEAHNAQYSLSFVVATILILNLTALVLTEIKADQKITEYTENVDRNKEYDKVMAVLGVQCLSSTMPA